MESIRWSCIIGVWADSSLPKCSISIPLGWSPVHARITMVRSSGANQIRKHPEIGSIHVRHCPVAQVVLHPVEQMITAQLTEFDLGIRAGRGRYVQVDDVLSSAVDNRRGGLLVN